MLTNELNHLFRSEEINQVLQQIAKTDDKRMCLNKDVMNTYRCYFEKIILLSFVVEILPNELKEIFADPESYLTRKLTAKLQIENVADHRDKIEKYLNDVLGNKQVIFHGTTSYMRKFFTNDLSNSYFNKAECETVDNIYRSHGIYKIFESGIRDFNENNFFITRSPSRSCFYALQSPEYFARFASRSDYYKQDIYQYDRIAYYRKDYSACYKNIKREMKEFGFNQQEKQIVLKNFRIMWDNIVHKDMKNIIFFKEIKENNQQHFNQNESLIEMLLKYFPKVNSKYEFNKFKDHVQEIVLPDVKVFLKRQQPMLNQKFVMVDNKKYIPDFYVDCKYSKHNYYTLSHEQCPLIPIDQNAQLNEPTTLMTLVNEARSNTSRAKQFFKQNSLPKVDDVIAYYQREFEMKLKELEQAKNLAAQRSIIKDICENVGLKYVVSLKYNQYFKDINQCNIYQYRKYLGVGLLETYEGTPVLTSEKVSKLIELYRKILSSKNFVLNEDVPLKILNKEIDVMYQPSETTKQNIAESVGLPYEKIIDMDDDEITAHIEKKNGKKMGYAQPRAMFVGSGDDSVYLDAGRLMTLADVDRKLKGKKSKFIGKTQKVLKGKTLPQPDNERSR